MRAKVADGVDVLEDGAVDAPAVRKRVFATLRRESRRMRSLIALILRMLSGSVRTLVACSLTTERHSNPMKFLIPSLLAAVLGLAPLGALAQTSPLSPGMDLTGTMDQTISSSSAYVGQPFKVSNVTSTGGDGAVTDATVYGHVAGVTKAGLGRNARVRLAFDSIRLFDGKRFPLDARPLHINVVTKSNATREGAGAIVGDLLGNYLGKVIGVGLLGPLGLIGGYLVAKNARQNVTVPQNSLVTLQIIRSLRQA